MELCFNYDTLNQRFDPPVKHQHRTDVQNLIPYSKKFGIGWCEHHNQWERILSNSSGFLIFSCGMPVQKKIGLNQSWNLNQYTIEYDFEKMYLSIKQKFTYEEVVNHTHYNPKIVFARCVDFASGRVYYPANFKLAEIPSFLNQYIDTFLVSCTKKLFGKEIYMGNASLNDYIRYPSCPNFSQLIPIIDNGKKYNFRNELNLFKEFCKWMKIKESKKLRKAFMYEPRTLLVYAMCQQIGFTDSNAINFIAENEEFLNLYAKPNNRLRFSMVRREVYMKDTYFHFENGFFCNLVDSLRLWVQNALTDKTQIVVARRFLNFMTQEDFHTIKDTGQCYLINARTIPVALHERILEEGFTYQIHNQVFALKKSDPSIKNIVIDYSPAESELEMIIYNSEVQKYCIDKNLSGKIFSKTNNNSFSQPQNEDELKNLVCDEKIDDVEVNDFDQELELPQVKSTFDIARRFKNDDISINDYYFLLPKDTNELYEISEAMRNCVGYLYRDSAVNKLCTIAIMMHKNRFAACIELHQKNNNLKYEIVQLKGPLNSIVKDDDLTAVKLWSRKNMNIIPYHS